MFPDEGIVGGGIAAAAGIRDKHLDKPRFPPTGKTRLLSVLVSKERENRLSGHEHIFLTSLTRPMASAWQDTPPPEDALGEIFLSCHSQPAPADYSR